MTSTMAAVGGAGRGDLGLAEAAARGRLWPSPAAGERRRLIVFVHGYLMKASDHVGLFAALRADPALADCDLLPWNFRAGLVANTDAAGVAQALATEIDLLDRNTPGGYAEIFLMGHSMGGVIARATLLDGVERGLAWALPANGKVRRLVLLAATNRGFTRGRLSDRLCIWLARHSVFPTARLGLSMLRGAPFVTGVRLRWLRAFEGAMPPETVQILGTRDPVVGPDDSADLFRYENSVTLPIDADHASVVPADADSPSFPHVRDALIGPLSAGVRPVPAAPRSRVVFLVHGIRDYGNWLDDLREAILRLDPEAEVLPVRYGYFKLLNFLAPSLRADKVSDFADRYAQELARRPGVPFAVAGHSNGTYILAHALTDVPGVRYERAYLAGSVLPDDFDWLGLIDRDKVGRVRNDTARGDWVVALICGTLSHLPIYRDLGVAGFAGFQRLPPGCESRYLPGDHGAALARNNIGSIAEFLVRGQPGRLDGLPGELPPWLDRGSRGLFWVLLVVVAVLAWLLIWVIPGPWNLYGAAALAGLAFLFLIAY